jgi:hypothetical protein
MASMSQQKEKEKPAPPVVPKDLLEYLEKCFPNRAPKIDTSVRQVWAAVGRQDVIEHLRFLFNRQNKPLE